MKRIDLIESRNGVRNQYIQSTFASNCGFSSMRCIAKWLSFDHATMTIMEALEMLANFLDESDPDVDESKML
ncbi:hypothetical protein OSTOST_18033 [Ostertagia ostertagi]